MIIEERARITKIIWCDIFLIDMPLLDTRSRPDNLVGKFISDIVLQILSFVAENERDFIKQRQAEGVKFGRPKCNLPDNYLDKLNDCVNKSIGITTALELLIISKSHYID